MEYETWCECTYVYSNETAKICWLISAFVVLLGGFTYTIATQEEMYYTILSNHPKISYTL